MPTAEQIAKKTIDELRDVRWSLTSLKWRMGHIRDELNKAEINKNSEDFNDWSSGLDSCEIALNNIDSQLLQVINKISIHRPEKE